MKTWNLIKTCKKCRAEYIGPVCDNKQCPHRPGCNCNEHSK